MIIIIITMTIIATIIYLNVILNLCNAILSSACIWRSFKQKIAGAITSFALPSRVLQKGVLVPLVLALSCNLTLYSHLRFWDNLCSSSSRSNAITILNTSQA